MPHRNQRRLEALQDMRSGTAALFRLSFTCRGFNVEKYSDDDLSRALLDEAHDCDVSDDLLASAFKRLGFGGKATP